MATVLFVMTSPVSLAASSELTDDELIDVGRKLANMCRHESALMDVIDIKINDVFPGEWTKVVVDLTGHYEGSSFLGVSSASTVETHPYVYYVRKSRGEIKYQQSFVHARSGKDFCG